MKEFIFGFCVLSLPLVFFVTGCAAVDDGINNWYRWQETHGPRDPNVKYCQVPTSTGAKFVECPKTK